MTTKPPIELQPAAQTRAAELRTRGFSWRRTAAQLYIEYGIQIGAETLRNKLQRKLQHAATQGSPPRQEKRNHP